MARVIRATGRLAVTLLAKGLSGWAAAALLLVSVLVLILSPLSGLPLLAVATRLTRPLAQVERRRVQAVTGRQVAAAYRPLQGSLPARARTILADPATWRDLAWLPLHFLVGCVGLVCLLVTASGVALLAAPAIQAQKWHHVAISLIFPVTSIERALAVTPIGLAVIVAGWWACRGIVSASARLSSLLLAPGENARLRARAEHLARTRAETVDARVSELRRIERDLHDGAQAHLVALILSLGMAEDEVRRDPSAAAGLLAEARTAANVALTELRDLIKGIFPPILTERGLGGAIEGLALASPVPVQVDVRLDQQLALPMESALYFVIAEAMTNIARHSQAARATVRIWRDDAALHLLICDDGRGGADPEAGSGLRGMQRRLAAFDGQLTVSSPPGGPTVLSAELPSAT